jgi:hypothetical protein
MIGKQFKLPGRFQPASARSSIGLIGSFAKEVKGSFELKLFLRAADRGNGPGGGEADVKGSIEPGKYADMTVLSNLWVAPSLIFRAHGGWRKLPGDCQRASRSRKKLGILC